MLAKYPGSQHETLVFSTYYAPRGRQRLYMLGRELSERYLYPSDLLIGIIGTEGAGKSTLIKGLFPGLELTNDDEGVNLRPTPLFEFDENDFFSGHTFHIDVRYESAFHQNYEIAEAINKAIIHNRRVVIEHFDLIYKTLGFNAQVIFGIGEEVIVARPTVFGPEPEAIRNVVSKTIKYRLMAHSAEDITSYILMREYGYTRHRLHSDIKHGFVIRFPDEPEIKIRELEEKVMDVIEKDLPIKSSGEDHIQIGEREMFCTGIRTHVKSTGKIENFHLLPDYRYDPISKEWMLVGIVGKEEPVGFDNIAPSFG
jgi:tRNA A37 threonylcarbamoyladenosine biosynthesis protein TsaE